MISCDGRSYCLTGCVNTFSSRTSQTSLPWSAFHLPASDFYNTLHCPDCYEVGDYFYGDCAPGWQTGLDGDTEERAVSMDRTHPKSIASGEHQHGKEVQIAIEWTHADGLRALLTGVTLTLLAVVFSL
jgi:hypothetical protein